MDDEAAAWLVKWIEGGVHCRRVFLSQDDALGWAARLTGGAYGECTGKEVVGLYERATHQEGGVT